MATYGISGGALTAEQVAQIAYQAGARGSDLEFLVGVARRESGYHPTAHRTDSTQSKLSGDRGLWQINYIWDQQLINAGIIRQKSDLFDPVMNAKAAMYVLSKQGRAAWGAAAGGWTQGGNPTYGVDMKAAASAVQSAANLGMLGQDYKSGSTAVSGSGKLPSDMIIGRINGELYAMYNMGSGQWIRYRATQQQADGKTINDLPADWLNLAVDGGDAAELDEIPTAFGTYGKFVEAIMDQLFVAGDPRRSDPEVMRVLATRAGRPDMTEAEFENLLKGTNYYQTRTEGQLRWNDLSEAERQVQRSEMEARMRQSFLTYMGRQPTSQELQQPGWASMVDDVASGKSSFNAWVENNVKVWAAQNPESPWSRQVRDEQESQRARPIEIENTGLKVRETLTRWGLQWSDTTIQQWARELTEKTKSDDDLMATIKTSAQVLFPWKDPEMETVVAAAPWIETYNRVLERQGSLQTGEIARALTAYGRDPDNNDPWSFEQKLKMTDQYDQTRQGQDDAWSTVGELAGLMGF